MESSLLSDDQLSEVYSWPSGRSFRLNMLLTEEMSSIGADGTSHSLTAKEDRRLLRIIRQAADVIIVGAESVRTEGWFLPPHGRLAVLTKTGNIPWETCPDKSKVSTHPGISSLLHSFHEDEQNILCEGGIATATLLSDTIGFDEVALTRFNSEIGTALPDFIHNTQDLKLESTLTDTQNNMSFQFWRRAVEHQ